MTDPTKALADAARRSVIATTRLRDDWSEAEGVAKNTLWRETHEASKTLLDAIAAYDAAQAPCLQVALTEEEAAACREAGAAQATEQVPPTDEKIETAVSLFGAASFCAGHDNSLVNIADALARQNQLLDLMRRARPNRQAPDSALLQAAKAVVDSSVSWDDVAGYNVGTDALENLNAEVERASKGGAA